MFDEFLILKNMKYGNKINTVNKYENKVKYNE